MAKYKIFRGQDSAVVADVEAFIANFKYEAQFIVEWHVIVGGVVAIVKYNSNKD